MLRRCCRLLHRGTVYSRAVLPAQARWCYSATGNWRELFDGNEILREDRTTGLFGVPELATAGGFASLTEKCLDDCGNILRELPNLRGVELVDTFDRLSNAICRVADLAAYIQHSHPNSLFREEANRCSLRLLHLTEEFNVNQQLHSYLARLLKAGDEFSALPEQAQRTAQLLMNDFELSGVHLDDAGRKECVALNQRLQVLTLRILSSFHEPVVLRQHAIPDVISEFAAIPMTEEGTYIINYQSEHYHPKVRLKTFGVFNMKHLQRSNLLYELLSCRHSLATAVGYSSYAERALRFSSAGTVDRVVEFLETLSEGLRPCAEKEIEVLKTFRTKLDFEGRYVLPKSAKPERDLELTDVHYLQHCASQHLCPTDKGEETLSFTVGSVMEGLNQLLQRTFGLRMHPVAVGRGEVWHDSVVKMAFERCQDDGAGSKWLPVGDLYCDFFQRPDKGGGDSHFTIRCGFNRPGHASQSPQSVLSCTSHQNVPLSIATVRTFFHEFGHGLHSMLGQPQYQHMAGTRCSNDFAEVPSELMEFFCSHEDVLALIADTKDADAARSLAERLQSKQQIFQALELQEQLAIARYDVEVHRRSPPCAEWVEGWYHVAQRRHASVPSPVDYSPHLRVSHVASYGATYYSYPWARATAALLWNELFAANPFSLEAGSRYRDMILCRGNSVPPSQMLANLLGKTPDISDLVAALVREVRRGNERLEALLEIRPVVMPAAEDIAKLKRARDKRDRFDRHNGRGRSSVRRR